MGTNHPFFLKMNQNRLRSKLPHLLLLTCVIATAIITTFFIAFIFHTALPVFKSEGIGFLTGTKWSYSEGVYGIRIFITGTLVMTGVTLLLAVPVSIFTAIFLSEFAPSRVANIMRPAIELLVGIPSVVYGIFGIFVLEDIFQDTIDPFLSGTLGFIPFFHDPSPNGGSSILLASTILAVMILPTITALSENAVTAVLVAIEADTVQVLDPETYETVLLKKPAFLRAEAGSDVCVIKTAEGLFLLP
ncbi:MAG: hypothetical protein ACT6FE_07750 [Methanosarcinaceae archaeon]